MTKKIEKLTSEEERSIKIYKKLVIPSDSAWGRKTWRRYVHWRIKGVIDGVFNIIKWIPTIYKDRHWDDYYITKILQKKIELQREYLVRNNIHTNINNDNFWMTVVLNLIERKHEDYYSMERFDYHKVDMIFSPVDGMPDHSEIKFKTKWENLNAYLAKYPSSVRIVKNEHFNEDLDNPNNKERLAFLVSDYNQKKCNNLLFEILKRYSSNWWD
jgi:hypothetical protein